MNTDGSFCNQRAAASVAGRALSCCDRVVCAHRAYLSVTLRKDGGPAQRIIIDQLHHEDAQEAAR